MNGFLSDNTKYVNKALKYSELSDGLANKIITCNSTYTVRFGVRLRGKIFTFQGWRSVHSEHMEPTKGGIRFDIDTHAEEVEALAALMSYRRELKRKIFKEIIIFYFDLSYNVLFTKF